MYSHPARERRKFAPATALAAGLVIGLFFVLPLVNQINIQRRLHMRGDLGAFAMSPPRPVDGGLDSIPDFSAPRQQVPLPVDGIAEAPKETKPVTNLNPLAIPKLEAAALSTEVRRGFVFDASDLDFVPVPIHRVPPVYPAVLNRQGIEGRAVVEFRVDEQGFVSDVVVMECTHPEFGESVVVAVERWRFLPGTIDGATVRFRMRLPVTFSLLGRGEPIKLATSK